MSLADSDLARLLVALAVLLIAAHAMGSLFARYRQPPAIGEILGGVLLGPTALAAIAPAVQQWIFPRAGPPAAVLALVFGMAVAVTSIPVISRIVSLVMLSVVTSLLAGSWLERMAGRLGAPARRPEQAHGSLLRPAR